MSSGKAESNKDPGLQLDTAFSRDYQSDNLRGNQLVNGKVLAVNQ